MTVDISRGGYAFLFNGFIHEGTIVHAVFTTLPDEPRLTGDVASCIYHVDGMYRIGIRFESA